jgi:hypothetical protein
MTDLEQHLLALKARSFKIALRHLSKKWEEWTEDGVDYEDYDWHLGPDLKEWCSANGDMPELEYSKHYDWCPQTDIDGEPLEEFVYIIFRDPENALLCKLTFGS